MAEHAVVEQAKGVLMLRYGIGSFEALAVIRRWASETQHSALQVSHTITHGICQGQRRAWDEDPEFIRALERRFRDDLATELPERHTGSGGA